MAGPKPPAAGIGALLVAALLIGACAGGQPKPESLPPQTMSDVSQTADDSAVTATDEVSEAEAPSADEAAPPAQEDATEDPDDSLILIDAGASEARAGEPTSLAQAAREEQARRRTAPPAQIVITDKNLADYATGQLTVMEESAEEEAAEPEEPEDSSDETYWRQRARAIREAWKHAAEQVKDLELEVAELRQRFYAEDDGFYRDSQIKPAWDRAIDKLAATQQEVGDRQQELEDFLEEGRQAGALPGWLREGIELEPEPEPDREPIHEPSEPEIYRQDESADPP